MSFVKATKKQSKLRAAISGPSGTGKSYTSLALGTNLGKKVALIDSERGSASKYSDTFDFDVCEINGNYHPDLAIKAIKEAVDASYDVVILDSASHFWFGPGGFLELVEEEVKKERARGVKADSYTAWKAVTPIYNRFIQGLLNTNAHLIVTLRAKTEYDKGTDGKVKKIGLAPQIRDDFEYEFDMHGMLDTDHNLVINKTRCPTLDGKVFHKPGKDIADAILQWLESGVPVVAPPPDTLLIDWSTKIQSATNLKELSEIAKAVKAANLSATDQDRVTSMWRTRQAELG